jgi:hypothetical protein
MEHLIDKLVKTPADDVSMIQALRILNEYLKVWRNTEHQVSADFVQKYLAALILKAQNEQRYWRKAHANKKTG